jgi:hypothetical protein
MHTRLKNAWGFVNAGYLSSSLQQPTHHTNSTTFGKNPCLATRSFLFKIQNNSIQTSGLSPRTLKHFAIHLASLSQLTVVLRNMSMSIEKMPLKRSLPFHNNNLEEKGPIALTLLSLQHDPQQHMPSPISMGTSEVLLQYLFERRIGNDWSTAHVQGNIRDVTQVITSYLWPRSGATAPMRHLSSSAGCTSAKAIPMASYGPAKKRLKTRYYLENQSISTAV